MVYGERGECERVPVVRWSVQYSESSLVVVSRLGGKEENGKRGGRGHYLLCWVVCCWSPCIPDNDIPEEGVLPLTGVWVAGSACIQE